MSNNKDLRKAAMGREKDALAEEGNGEFARFTSKNTKVILGVFAFIIIAIVAFKLVSDNNAKNLKEASTAYYRAEKFYKAGDFETALNGSTTFMVRGNAIMGFKKIADNFSGTTTGKTAAFKAGLCYLKVETPDIAAARTYFEKATKSKSPAILMGAYANIAALDEEAGNFDQAATGYQKAAEQAIDDETKSRYLYFSALVIEAGGKKEEAVKKYQELLKVYDKTSFATEAKISLLRLGIEIE